MDTPSNPKACDGESVIALDGAICKFRTDEPFWSLSGYERVFITEKIAYFMISE